jgi:hypothetical protein
MQDDMVKILKIEKKINYFFFFFIFKNFISL